MNILVYGAGVLGSYLAHELHNGKHNVTIIARGERYNTLKTKGLIINHIRQKNETVDHLQVKSSLDPDDAYDVIFVVMQKSQLGAILPILAQNTASKRIVFIGNNCRADETYSEFMQMSKSKPKIYFGFLSCGGNRQGDKINNWHGNSCEITIGTIPNMAEADSSMASCENELKDFFTSTNLKLVVKPDINAWLKYHSALITPLCLAIQYEGGASKHLRKSKALELSIQAVKECVQMFEKMGFCKDAPHDMSLLNWPTSLLKFGLGCFLPTKTGHYVAISHALAAVGESEQLTKEILICSKEYNNKLPSFVKLNSMLNKSGITKKH